MITQPQKSSDHCTLDTCRSLLNNEREHRAQSGSGLTLKAAAEGLVESAGGASANP